ncbi:MAG: SRPBCC family protein [Sulfuricella denitrificans]|nr:SRPBCC family protein [Sulfuricella denitrificans]
MRARLALFLVASSPCIAQALILPEQDINVHTERDGDTLHVTVDMRVAVKPRRAWEVMTDFDRMAEFIPNLSSSKIASRKGNLLKVEQKGSYSLGLWNFPFESMRDVALFPYSRITSHATSGSMKNMDSITYLEADGQNTRINYNATLTPSVSIPSLIGATLVSNEVRERFHGMRDEMVRREQSARLSSPNMAAIRKKTQRGT